MSYSTLQDFQEIIFFLSLARNMRTSACSEAAGASRSLQTWAGGSDEAEETVWRTYNTNDDIKVKHLQESKDELIVKPKSKVQVQILVKGLGVTQ